MIAREKALWASAETDLRARENLVAMLVAGGAHSIGAIEARLFELLERIGVFLVGGVLVGSHAFGNYGNMLGVRWPSDATRTQDVDIAATTHLVIAYRIAGLTCIRHSWNQNWGSLRCPPSIVNRQPHVFASRVGS